MQESIVFLLRVQCRRKESSRSLSHLLMSFLSAMQLHAVQPRQRTQRKGKNSRAHKRNRIMLLQRSDLNICLLTRFFVYCLFYLFIFLLYESYTKYKKNRKKKEKETDRQTDRQTTECNQHVDKQYIMSVKSPTVNASGKRRRPSLNLSLIHI